MMCKSL